MASAKWRPFLSASMCWLFVDKWNTKFAGEESLWMGGTGTYFRDIWLNMESFYWRKCSWSIVCKISILLFRIQSVDYTVKAVLKYLLQYGAIITRSIFSKIFTKDTP